jgi:hypothetical protein
MTVCSRGRNKNRNGFGAMEVAEIAVYLTQVLIPLKCGFKLIPVFKQKL